MRNSSRNAFRPWLAGLFASLALAPAVAAEQGDAKAGQAYARAACAQCHAVELGRSSPVASAPAFEKIANMPGMNLMALDVWMRTGHPTMPLLKITATQTEDLAAWLATLKTPKSAGGSSPN